MNLVEKIFKYKEYNKIAIIDSQKTVSPIQKYIIQV